MKKFLLLTFAFLTLLSPAFASAQMGIDSALGELDKNVKPKLGNVQEDVGVLSGTVINTAFSLVGIIFIILMVYSGFLWMTARGEESQVEKSQKIIVASMSGLVILVGSYAVTNLVVTQLNLAQYESKTGNNLEAVKGQLGTVETDVGNVAGQFINIALSLVGLIFLILMVYAGYLWMTARGEESQIEKAQKIVVAAITGLVLLLSAYAITYLVTNRFQNAAPPPVEEPAEETTG